MVKTLISPLGNRKNDPILTPEMFPCEWDPSTDTVSFESFNPEVFDSDRFLGQPQSTGSVKRRASATLGDILLSAESVEKGVAKHYVFHPAYCCSTLLTKYLSAHPYHLTLKEPSLISSFAVKNDVFSHRDRLRLLAIHRILTRVFPGQDFIAVKPNVPVNPLAREILACDPAVTATFIVQDFEQGVTSVLKYGWRVERVRGWSRNLYRKALLAGRSIQDPESLTPPQLVSFWWIENTLLAGKTFAGAGSSRVLLAHANDISDDPRVVLAAIGSLSGMERLLPRIESMLSEEVATTYSKNRATAFSRQERRIEIRDRISRFSDAINTGKQWMKQVYGEEVEAAMHLTQRG